MICCYIEGKVWNWDVDLLFLVMVFYVIENCLIGYIFNRLMFGCEVVLLVDIVIGMVSFILIDYELDEWVRYLDKVMEEVYLFVRK